MSALTKLHGFIKNRAVSPHAFYPASYQNEIAKFTKDISENIHGLYQKYLKETVVAHEDLSLEENLQLQYYFNSINFCYWSDLGEEKWNVLNNKGEKVDGSEAMLVALEKAKIYAMTCTEISELNVETFEHMLGGYGSLLLTSKRLEILQHAAQLLEHYEGKYSVLVRSCAKDPMKLLELLASSEAFVDSTMVKNDSVPFLKRAQLLVKVTQDLLPAEETFQSLSGFTAFSDYKVPQILETLGLLEYSTTLRQQLDAQIHITKDSEEEAAIRLMTVYIVEDLRRSLAAVGINLSAPEIDSLLWNLSNLPPYNKASRLYHRTVTTAY